MGAVLKQIRDYALADWARGAEKFLAMPADMSRIFGPLGQFAMRLLYTADEPTARERQAAYLRSPADRDAIVVDAIAHYLTSHGIVPPPPAAQWTTQRAVPDEVSVGLVALRNSGILTLEYPHDFAAFESFDVIEDQGRQLVLAGPPLSATYNGLQYFAFTPMGNAFAGVQLWSIFVLAMTMNSFVRNCTLTTTDPISHELVLRILRRSEAVADEVWATSALKDFFIRHEWGHTLEFRGNTPVRDALLSLGAEPTEHLVFGKAGQVQERDGLVQMSYILSDVLANLTAWTDVTQDELDLWAAFVLANAVPPQVRGGGLRPVAVFALHALRGDHDGLLKVVTTLLRRSKDDCQAALVHLADLEEQAWVKLLQDPFDARSRM